MKMIKLAVALLVLFTQTFVYANTNKKLDVDELARTFMQENKIEGMSIAVINQNNLHIYNYGFANELKRIPTSSDTIYTIASFTKTFTAGLSAVAVVENKLNLNQSFNQYIPGLSNDADLQRITPNTLLGHVSSLPFDFYPRPKTTAEIVDAYRQFKQPYPSGSEYSYSNASIGTMGYVLQNIYGKNYQEILDEKILKPLSMRSTYLNVPREKEKFISLAHDKDNKVVPYNKNNEAWFAAASLKSSIADMGKYLHAQMNYSVINNKEISKAFAMVHQNKYCFSDKVSCEQLAWQAHDITELRNTTGDSYFKEYDSHDMPVFDKKIIVGDDTLANHHIFIDKTGSGYGMSSYMAYIPDQKVGVVILINKTVSDPRIRLGRDILLAFTKETGSYDKN